MLLAAAGDLDQARESFRQSLLVYTQIGASWCVRRAEGRLQPYGLRRAAQVLSNPDDAGLLTPVELRIAELVAAGWPNPDIAVRLDLPQTAVQTHVTAVVDKLGVDYRLGLTPQALARYQATSSAQPSPQTAI